MTFGVVGLVNLLCAVIGIYYSIDMYIYEYIYIYHSEMITKVSFHGEDPGTSIATSVDVY